MPSKMHGCKCIMLMMETNLLHMTPYHRPLCSSSLLSYGMTGLTRGKKQRILSKQQRFARGESWVRPQRTAMCHDLQTMCIARASLGPAARTIATRMSCGMWSQPACQSTQDQILVESFLGISSQSAFYASLSPLSAQNSLTCST